MPISLVTPSQRSRSIEDRGWRTVRRSIASRGGGGGEEPTYKQSIFFFLKTLFLQEIGMFKLLFLLIVIQAFINLTTSRSIDSSKNGKRILDDFDNSVDIAVSCSEKTSSNDLLDSSLENDSLDSTIENDSNIVRRESAKFCIPNSQNLPNHSKIPSPTWRASDYLRRLTPHDVSVGNARDSEFCLDFEAQSLVSCAGPEIYYYNEFFDTTIGFVLNCVDGKFQTQSNSTFD